MTTLRSRGVAALAAALLSASALAQSPDPLLSGFQSPPDTARPRVWWHWLSGNVDKAGITLDMEWMHRIGIRGLQMFDGDMGAPQVVPHRVTAMSAEWLADLRFAASEAKRLGMEFGMAAGPGWSETGGPWVVPEGAMKKLVWSSLEIEGGHRFDGALPPPPANPGPFQDVPKEKAEWGPAHATPDYYKDVAVLAWRSTAAEIENIGPAPKVTSSMAGVDARLLMDGKLDKTLALPLPTPEAPVWIQTEYVAPRTIRALTYAGPLPGRFVKGPEGTVEASDDGTNWRVLASLPSASQTPAPERTIALPATRARFFRVTFSAFTPSDPSVDHLNVAELSFSSEARVNAFEDKAGFGILAEDETLQTPDYGDAAIREDGIIDVTSALKPDGHLSWTPPPGHWTVMRFGWSLTGVTNHPATPEATGLEVDKLDAEQVRHHLDAYLAPVLDQLGPLVGKNGGLSALITDSWEAGTQTWTKRLPEEFRARRGYDLLPWLPVLAGRVVGSASDSDRFLWDFRRTLADLLAEKHYGTITEFARQKDLHYYGEAVGASWPTIADGMQAKRLTDIPTGEFWAMPFGGKPAAYQGVVSDEFPADIAETASTAHVYGKPIVAAEAFTSSQPLFQATPWSLKWVADKYMAAGVNRLLIHTSPHQPSGTKRPGLTLGPFGQAFTRNETWASMAGPWIDYLSRSSYLLQQGRPVADILYFYGEGAPSGVPYREQPFPDTPPGFAADYINGEALRSEVSAADGRLVTRGGASYRVLVLPTALTQMTLPLARKLMELVRDGAVLVGPKPTSSPSRADSAEDLRAICNALWGSLDGRLATRTTYEKGRVYWGTPLADVLADLDVPADFAAPASGATRDILYAHRARTDADIYFVSNQSAERKQFDVQLRSTRASAALWSADDGSTVPVFARRVGAGTIIALDLAPYEAKFIVLRDGGGMQFKEMRDTAPARTMRLGRMWSIQFEPGLGAPTAIASTDLRPLNSYSDPAVRYFSGIATYRSTFALTKRMALARDSSIDLGQIGGVGRVRVNGRDAGIAWKPPYRVKVAGLLHAGSNRIEVDVANSWRNRLIGDAQPGKDHQNVAFTSQKPGGGDFGSLGGPITADSPLVASGLFGPVTLEWRERK